MIHKVARLFLANLGHSILGVAFIASLSLNIWLGWRIQRPTPGGIQISGVLRTVSVSTAAGLRREIIFAGELPTLLYVLSPTCSWCKRNHDNVIALAKQVRGRYRLIAIVNEASSPRAVSATTVQGLENLFDVVYSGTRSLLTTGDLDATPQLSVVSGSGIIERTWVGAEGRVVLSRRSFLSGICQG